MSRSIVRRPLAHWMLASLLLHAGVAVWWLQRPPPRAQPQPSAPLPVRVVTFEAAPPPAPVVEPPPVEPPPRPAPKPVVRRPVAESLPEPVAEPVPQVAAVEEPSAPAPPAVAAAPPSAAPGPSVEDLLDRYKALLLARIAAQKRYPAMARRRGIEGDVTLRLRIDAAGDLAGVETLGRAPLVLAKQARTAAQKAAPFPPPPGGEFAIDFVLRFSLTD